MQTRVGLKLNPPIDGLWLEHEGFVAASLRRRFVALVLDGILGSAIAVGVAIALGQPVFSTEEQDTVIGLVILLSSAVPLYLILVYASATPGKLLTGIYVGTKTGERIGYQRALIRVLVFSTFFSDFWLPEAYLLSLFVLVVSFFMALSDPMRRTLHDRVAGTLVLVGRAPPREAPVVEVIPRL